MSDLDIRVRLAKLDGTISREIPAENIMITDVDSGSARLTMDVSEVVAGNLEDPFIVAYEYSTGGAWRRPRNDLFICSEGGEDGEDITKSVGMTGVGLIPWLMARMYVQGTGTTGVDERTWPNATPGTLVNAIVAEAKAWGWGPHVTTDFTATHDSNGVAWTTEDRTDITWRVGTPCSQVLQRLAEQGVVEWWTEGTTLRLFRAGTGTNRASSISFGGAGFSRAPRKTSFDNVFTDLTVFMEDRVFFNIKNAGADTRFGTLWATMSQSGVTNAAVARKLIQPAMTQGRAKAQELSYQWAAKADLPVPFKDFTIGDVVKARTRNGKLDQRVIGLVISKDTDQVDITAVTGSKMLSLVAKLAKRTAAASMGTVIGGSGDNLPPGKGPAGKKPLSPTGLHVKSNVADWRIDGPVSTVTFGWDEVAQSEGGAALPVAEYELWSRPGPAVASLAARTAGLEATLSNLTPLETRFVSVRARSYDGVWSARSAEISVTPAYPASATPMAPSGLAVIENVGTFAPDGSAISRVKTGWEPVTLSTDSKPIKITGYELWEGTVDNPGVVLVSTPNTGSAFSTPSGTEKALRVRVRGVSGVWSDFSAPLPFTAAWPEPLTTVPNDPTLLTTRGIVAAMFDGQSTTGPIGNGFQHVITEVSVDNVEFNREGQPLNGPGTVILAPPVGTQVWVRFVPIDTLGRPGTPSGVATIVCAGISGPDIEANSVLANHIGAGEIEVSHLKAGIGDMIDISGNLTVTTLQNQSEATQGQVDALYTWITMDGEGLHIGRSDSPFQTHQLATKFSITENGVETTYWEAGRMVVPRIEVEEADIAGHKWSKYGTGTVVKRLG